MSKGIIPSSTVADGTEAATEAERALNVLAGTQSCASCASLSTDLGIANKRYDAIQEAMTKMEHDTIVSTELANQREQQMFTLKSESEAAMLKLQGEHELLKQRLKHSEQEARHARSELEQATENNFCLDPAHAIIQEDLDSANCEMTELRITETALEEKVGSMRELVAEMQNQSASTLGRKLEQGRQKSSGLHPAMSALPEEEKEGADGEYSNTITGSELVIAGGIPRKVGDRRFTCFGNGNEYFELVKIPMQQSYAEDDSEINEEKSQKHNGLSMDTNVPNMLKQAMIISSESDNMQDMKIKSRETMDISKFVTAITRQLRNNKAGILAAANLGGFVEYQEVVGAVSGLNTWNRKIYAYLNTHHGEKFCTAVVEGGHKQMKIEFIEHARHGGSEDFDVLRHNPETSQHTFFSFWAFAALAKASAGNEFGLNPRGYGLSSGRAASLRIL